MSIIRIQTTLNVVLLLAQLMLPRLALASDLSAKKVLDSLHSGTRFLIQNQNADGSWTPLMNDQYPVGVTSLAVMALLNSGVDANSPPIQRGLQFLRSVQPPDPRGTYEVALMIMALATAKQGSRDKTLIFDLAQKLERSQNLHGAGAGIWGYNTNAGGGSGGDRSNGQFAILGLRDAALSGIAIEKTTWERAQRHWINAQNGDGGWSYSGAGGGGSSGSMTVAGIATMVITSAMLRDAEPALVDGVPDCCRVNDKDDAARKALDRGLKWMANHFAVGTNPGSGGWLLYYLYGMERAGRLSAHRFFGKHDWYREGARFLIERQAARGSWSGAGGLETDPVVGTSFALLFLSKGLAPVLINKLEYGADTQWNLHPRDIQNLTDFILTRPGWPKLMTWQILDIDKVVQNGSVSDLLQAPVLYLTGETLLTEGESGQLKLSDAEIMLLRDYVNYGGFILAVTGCQRVGFNKGIRELVAKMYPEGEASLKPLPPEHPIYGAEYNLQDLAAARTIELQGVDIGCRTAIVYAPDAISCLWDYWQPGRSAEQSSDTKGMITRAIRVGTNIIAYATGREPPAKLHTGMKTSTEGQQDRVRRGLVQIAKLRHTGGWNAAPQALRNLLFALNRTGALTACTEQRNLLAADRNIFQFPILYMQGRNHFQMGQREQDNLRTYVEMGGVLFADACCGAPQFDASFRDLMKSCFPAAKLERIPPDHEIFTSAIGHDIRRVRRRVLERDARSNKLIPQVREGEPYLEGIQIDGRYAVIYSKYDISCALQHQAAVACTGYTEEDAIRIATNIVLYALLQDVQ